MTLREQPASAMSGGASGSRWSGKKALRWAVNTWLIFHLSAIIIAPASVGPSSSLVLTAWQAVHPYLQVLYLNNGYHFFAPEPSPSTLLAFEAKRADGSVVQGRIPNFGIQPRLLYHRHFMLTERMGVAPPELEQRLFNSYAQHIGSKYGATQVRLTRQVHLIPTLEMVRKGVRLDDPGSYKSELLGDFPCDTY